MQRSDKKGSFEIGSQYLHLCGYDGMKYAMSSGIQPKSNIRDVEQVLSSILLRLRSLT